MDDCVEIEVDFSDEVLKVIYMHMLKTGLNFNDAATELIIMGMQADGIDV